jgi:hypothetical protein
MRTGGHHRGHRAPLVVAALVWRSLGWAPVQYDAGKDPENEGRGRGPGWIIAYTAPPCTHPTRLR